MSRYIDADAFKKYLKEKFEDIKDQFQTEEMRSLAQTITNDFCRDIDEQPTVDAVPVVRCEECKNLGNNDGYYFCNAIGLAFGNKPNWFCADGERRTDEQ